MTGSPASAHAARYTVQGMTCEHCVAAVTAEVRALPGVTDVEVDLAAGSLSVRSDRQLGRDEVAAAVDEAGYALAEA